MGGDDVGAVPVGDALDLRAEVLVGDHGDAGLERVAVRAALHAVPGQVLGAVVPRQDRRQHLLLHRVEPLGHLLDQLQLRRAQKKTSQKAFPIRMQQNHRSAREQPADPLEHWSAAGHCGEHP